MTRVPVYDLCYHRATFAELGVVSGALVKTFRLRPPASTDDPNLETVAPFEVPADVVPRSIHDQFQPILSELNDLGFHSPIYHIIKIPTHHTAIYWYTLLHESGRAIARIHHRVWNYVSPPRRHLFPIFYSEIGLDRFVMTSGGKLDLISPPEWVVGRKVKADATELWELHLEQLDDVGRVTSVRNAADIRSFTDRLHATVRDFQLERGIFVPSKESVLPRSLTAKPAPVTKPATKRPLSPIQPIGDSTVLTEEFLIDEDFVADDLIESISDTAPTRRVPRSGRPALKAQGRSAPQSSDSDEVDELDELESSSENDSKAPLRAEIDRLLNKQTSWGGAILILVISGLVFAAVGAMEWDPTTLAMLAGVLLFHELGHLLAMKALGYRDTKMFFIPFFGAAVTGRHLSAPGWKRVIVSLMGPVPGILVGAGLGLAGVMTDHKWLLDLAFMSLAINAINLVPMLPFDGGHVVHTLLFCRHPVLDVVFRLLAALTLGLLALAIGAKILIYIAVAALFSLPTAYRLANITKKLRDDDEDLNFEPTANNSIPTRTANVIIDEVQANFPKAINQTIAAQHVVSVFETVNAHPPSAINSFMLLLVHAGSVVFAIVAGSLLFLAKQGNFANIMGMAANRPEMPFTCGSSTQVATVPGQADLSARDELTVVATAASESDAQRIFGEQSVNMPAGTELSRFGKHLFALVAVEDAGGKAAWIGRFESAGLEVAVSTSDEPSYAALQFISNDPAWATQLQEDLAQSSRLTWLCPGTIQPWFPEWVAATDEQRAKWRKCRADFGKAQQSQYEGSTDSPELQAAIQQQIKAMSLKDKAEIKRLSDRVNEIQKALRLKNWAAFRESAQDMAPEFLDACEQVFDAQNTVVVIPEDVEEPDELQAFDPHRINPVGEPLAEFVGVVPRQNNRVAPGGMRLTVNTSCEAEGFIVNMSYVTCDTLGRGLPHFTQWLCDQGCVDIRYTVDQSTGFD